MDFDGLKRQILHNCDVTDARHAGIYSVCGLVMRLRDLYKWEHRLQPWQDDAPGAVLEWIGKKEELWESMTADDFVTIRINGRRHDAFDTADINAAIDEYTLYYGAGYAHSLKPTFFLADIDRREVVAGHPVVTTGREYARDLLTLPAFSQNGAVVLRKEASRMFLWDQIVYLGQSGRRALEFAAQACGLPDARIETLRRHFDAVWQSQTRLYVQHEIGELEDTVFDRGTWQQMMADFPHSAVELLGRTLKDLLADTGTNGALTRLIERRDKRCLGLYMAFGNGMARMLTKPLICAFDAFLSDARWHHIESAARAVRRESAVYAGQVADLYRHAKAEGDPEPARAAIEDTMVQRGLLSKRAQ